MSVADLANIHFRYFGKVFLEGFSCPNFTRFILKPQDRAAADTFPMSGCRVAVVISYGTPKPLFTFPVLLFTGVMIVFFVPQHNVLFYLSLFDKNWLRLKDASALNWP